jgi:hypothetical protein
MGYYARSIGPLDTAPFVSPRSRGRMSCEVALSLGRRIDEMFRKKDVLI